MDSSGKPTHLAYELKLKPDGTAVVNLSNVHKAWLKYLAVNGGEVIIDWEQAEMQRLTPKENRRETIKQHMSKLNEMGLTVELPLLVSSRSLVRLTDTGRNIVAEILKSEPIA
jgi:hypothetical protein